MAAPLLFTLIANVCKHIVIALLPVIGFLYLVLKYKCSYWERQGFPHVKATVPWGNLLDFIMVRESLPRTVARHVYNAKRKEKYAGYYALWTPILLIIDPELIKQVMVKDFNYFANRGMYQNVDIDPLSNHLFAMDGPQWKATRSKLVVMFSSTKIRMLFSIMKKCTDQLNDCLNDFAAKGKEVIEFKDLISRHAVNVIANSAIGVEGHNLQEQSTLYDIAVMTTAPTVIQGFRFAMVILAKDYARLINMRFTPKVVEKYYLEMAKQIVEYRVKNKIVRHDFMGMLLEMWDGSMTYETKEKAKDDTTLSLSDLAAQTFIFILAAYETTASTVCFTLYELAYNQEIQDKLREEVDQVGPYDDVTYEKLLEMKYMMMVLNETWRKYPPAGLLFRQCVKDYTFPDGRVVKKGTTVTASPAGMQHDPEYFPEPDKFDPERFNKNSPTYSSIPFTFLPFGDGQRKCIGKPYGIMQSILTVFGLVSNYKFELANETQIPPVIDPKTFLTQPEGGMYLKMTPRY